MDRKRLRIGLAVALATAAVIAFAYRDRFDPAAVASAIPTIRTSIIALALLALVSFLPRLAKRLRGTTSTTGSTLAPRDLKARLARGEALLVLDLRDAGDYAGGHIAGARDIPLPELAARLGELGDWRERPVALVCRTDRRSTQAQTLLRASGFCQSHVVQGGMQRWTEDGLPLER